MLYSYTQWCSCSDHLAVVRAILRDNKGPSQWHLPDDVLNNPMALQIVQKVLASESDLSAGLQWENTKLNLCSHFQDLTKFQKV